MSNKPKFIVSVDYVGSYWESGWRGQEGLQPPSNHITNLKKASDPPMTNDDGVPSKDDDVWVAFDDDFDDMQQANVIASNVLLPNLVHPIVGTSRFNMA